MMNRIIGLVGMAAAVFMWVMAGATLFRMVGVWPDEVVLHLFMTALCTLSGVALWSFGTVYLGRAREAKEARRRERLGLDPAMPGEAGAADGARDHDAQGADVSGPESRSGASAPVAGAGSATDDGTAAEASSPVQGGSTVQSSSPVQDGSATDDGTAAALAPGAAGSVPEGSASVSDAASAPEAGTGGVNEGVAAVDLRDISLENIAPEHFALAFDGAAKAEAAEGAGSAGSEAQRGLADIRLRSLPEVREALANTGRARVKLVRKVVGAGQDPLLVVLLGWTPIAKVKPGTPEYQALIGFAGKEGEVSAEPAAAAAAANDEAIEARLDMRS